MSELSKIEALFYSEVPENIELAFYLLANYQGEFSRDFVQYIMQEVGYVERCVQLKCRAIYPYITTASISFYNPDNAAESEAFWQEFTLLAHLEKLTLSNLKYTAHWSAVLPAFKQLKTLSLNQNRLEFLPQPLADLRQLHTLAVNEEYITTLPDFLLEFAELKSLSIRYCQLTKLPDWIVKMQSLEALILPDNLLLELPVSIGFLKHLRYLDVSNNQLKRLPPTLTELESLTHLFISNNSISPQEKSQWYNILPQTLIL